MAFALDNNFLSLNQDTNQFLIYAKIELQISYTTTKYYPFKKKKKKNHQILLVELIEIHYLFIFQICLFSRIIIIPHSHIHIPSPVSTIMEIVFVFLSSSLTAYGLPSAVLSPQV